MSITIVRKGRETILPAAVADAAGIEDGDQIEWRFENGEVRGLTGIFGCRGNSGSGSSFITAKADVEVTAP